MSPEKEETARTPHEGCQGLVAIEGISLLGDHDGVLDDDLFGDLAEDEVFGPSPLTNPAP